MSSFILYTSTLLVLSARSIIYSRETDLCNTPLRLFVAIAMQVQAIGISASILVLLVLSYGGGSTTRSLASQQNCVEMNVSTRTNRHYL